MFTKGFDDYVCQGDWIVAENESGFDVIATVHRDEDYHIDDDDVHNPDQSVTGCNDIEHLKVLSILEAWFDDEWFYCGVVLSVIKNGVTLVNYGPALWGIEANYPGGDNSYLTEVANELLPEAIAEAKEVLARLTEEK